MTKVLEVASAEDVTGHLNSLAITAPDRVTFVKGTCPEEAKWWLNILSAFPKTKVRILWRFFFETHFFIFFFLHHKRDVTRGMQRFLVDKQQQFYNHNVSTNFL